MLKIEYLSVDEIKPYANNAKMHPAEQVEQIKKSIEEFGFNDPVAIWGNNEVIEGHDRLVSAIELGMDKIPVIRLDALTDEQRRAYALVHNKLTMNSDFDTSLLELELDDIAEIDMSEFGFDTQDLEIDESDLDDDTEKTKVNVSIVFSTSLEFEQAKERLENIAEEFNTNLSIKMI